MKNDRSFGKYLRERRIEKGLSMKKVCETIRVSVPYMSDVENDRTNPPVKEKLDMLIQALSLSMDEQHEFYDLAGWQRKTVSPDIQEYIMEKDVVRMALRTARDADISDEMWEQFADRIQKEQELADIF